MPDSKREEVSVILAAWAPPGEDSGQLSVVHQTTDASAPDQASLLRDLAARGGYRAAHIGYCRGTPDVEAAIERAVAEGSRRVVVTPVFSVTDAERWLTGGLQELADRVERARTRYADVDIIQTDVPLDHEGLLNLILSKLREYEAGVTVQQGELPLSDLAVGEAGTVRALSGGTTFLSRMAALGFTPGALVRMVQNYRHGAIIVKVRGARVALGRGEARRVRVSKVPNP